MTPFEIEYFKSEIEFYGIKEYDKDGIKIITKQLNGPCPELFNKWFWIGELDIPIFYIDKELWMSLTPMELQSAYLPICGAEGKTAIGGVGTGYIALRMAGKEDVKSIDIYEIDQRVIDFFNEQFSDRKGFDKINIIHGDIRKTMHSKVYDFAFIDIYQTMLPNDVIDDHILFNDNNTIKNYYFWAQEKPLLHCIEDGINLTFKEQMFFLDWNEAERDIGRGETCLLSDMHDPMYDDDFATECVEVMGRV